MISKTMLSAAEAVQMELRHGSLLGDVEFIPAGTTDPTGKKASDPGAKLDGGKPKWYLLPWEVIEGVVKVMTFGAAKYSEAGWKSVPQAKERYFAAMMRHWMLMESGEYTDPDSNLPHWAHFACNAVFLGWFHLKARNDSE